MLLRAGGANASLVLRQLLLPPLVWRAGKTAAAVRFAAVTALATMLRHQLAPADVLLELMSTSASRPPQEQQPQDQQPQEQQQQQPPWLADTFLSRSKSSRPMTPALMWGSRPVSRITAPAAACT